MQTWIFRGKTIMKYKLVSFIFPLLLLESCSNNLIVDPQTDFTYKYPIYVGDIKNYRTITKTHFMKKDSVALDTFYTHNKVLSSTPAHTGVVFKILEKRSDFNDTVFTMYIENSNGLYLFAMEPGGTPYILFPARSLSDTVPILLVPCNFSLGQKWIRIFDLGDIKDTLTMEFKGLVTVVTSSGPTDAYKFCTKRPTFGCDSTFTWFADKQGLIRKQRHSDYLVTDIVNGHIVIVDTAEVQEISEMIAGIQNNRMY